MGGRGARLLRRSCARLALGAQPKANGVMWTVTGQICLREKGEPKSTHQLSLNSCGQEDPVTLASLNLFTFQLWPRINSCLRPVLSRRGTRKKGPKGILMEMWPGRRNPRQAVSKQRLLRKPSQTVRSRWTETRPFYREKSAAPKGEGLPAPKDLE